MSRLKTGKRGEYLTAQFLWVTARLVVTCLNLINPVNCLFVVAPGSCEGHEMLW